MSLPSRPNRPSATGAPRTRPSAARTGDEPSDSSSRTVRAQRSLNQLPSRPRPSGNDYDALPSAPRARTRSTAGRDERSRERGGGRERERERPPLPSQRDSGYGSSSASGSGSSGASFLDRMRVRSSDTTPRTSVDDGDRDDDRKRERRARSSRRRDDDDEPPRRDNRKSVVAQASAEGDGSWLWKSVAAAAGNLTLNINKAWTTKVATYTGEETPPGEESRLTRAMKAYHLHQAQKPSDLPDWLFPESERRAPRPDDDRDQKRDRPRHDRDRSRPRVDYEEDEPPMPRGRGLRDIYDSAAREVARPTPAPTRSYASADVGDAPAPSKAANRLKALRDAKRAAAGVRDPSPEPVRQVVREEVPVPVARPRVGLPTGPGRVRRPA